MTPLQIEIVLHYHTSCTDYRDGDFSAPAVQDAIYEFEHFGILVRDQGIDVKFHLTPKGLELVGRICAVQIAPRVESHPFTILAGALKKFAPDLADELVRRYDDERAAIQHFLGILRDTT